MKKSEARIIIFLSQVTHDLKYATMISRKLDMDYSYVLEILYKMISKGMVEMNQDHNKKLYTLINEFSLIKEAKEVMNDGRQTDLSTR